MLNESNGKSMSTVQLVLEFQSPFWDDSPIHDSDTESTSLSPATNDNVRNDVDDDKSGNNMIENHHPNESNPPKSPTDDSKSPPKQSPKSPESKSNGVSSSNTNTNDNSNAVALQKGEPGAPQETRREDFSHLFSTMPHNCVMEQDCHIFISDSPQFMKKSMVVIGMVRDSEKDIIATLQQLDEISCLFDQIVYIFYESNSKDNTPYVLEDWNVMYLDGKHCDLFRFNPNTNASTTS